VTSNFGNDGNSGGFPLHMNETSPTTIACAHHRAHSLRYTIPNDLHPAGPAAAARRRKHRNQRAIYFQHTISSNLVSVFPAACAIAFLSGSNPSSHSRDRQQESRYREGYIRGDIAGHRGITTGSRRRSFSSLRFTKRCSTTHDPSQFDPGTQLNLISRAASGTSSHPLHSDQMRYGGEHRAGLRFDHVWLRGARLGGQPAASASPVILR